MPRTWDAVWKVLQMQSKRSGMGCTLASGRISDNFFKSEEASVVVTVWVWSHMPIHNLRRLETPHIGMTWIWDAVWKVLQPYSKHGGMDCTLASGRISPNSHKSGATFCVGNGASVNPYAHPQPEKVLKHLIHLCHGYGMQFPRFYSLKQSIVAWFSHLHQVGFQPTFPYLGKHLWW